MSNIPCRVCWRNAPPFFLRTIHRTRISVFAVIHQATNQCYYQTLSPVSLVSYVYYFRVWITFVANALRWMFFSVYTFCGSWCCIGARFIGYNAEYLTCVPKRRVASIVDCTKTKTGNKWNKKTKNTKPLAYKIRKKQRKLHEVGRTTMTYFMILSVIRNEGET